MKQYMNRVNDNRETSSVHRLGKPGQLVAMHENENDHFAVLYTQHFPQVLQYIRFHNGTAHPEAEDIAQDIFLILWRRRDKLEEIGPLENYLFIMVKNRLINERKKAAVRERIWRQIKEESSKYTYAPRQELFCRKAERWLRAAIDSLPLSARTAYILRELHGLKVHKIARTMGISQAGASRKLQEAEKQIRLFIASQII